jgi:hypothetical protein
VRLSLRVRELSLQNVDAAEIGVYVEQLGEHRLGAFEVTHSQVQVTQQREVFGDGHFASAAAALKDRLICGNL